MTLKPSAQRLGGAAAFAVLIAIQAYFLPSPHPDRTSLAWSLIMGFGVGYLIWPVLQAVKHLPGYWQPTPTRVFKAIVAAGLATVLLAYLQVVVLDGGLNIEGLLVSFLVIASFAYVSLGGTSRPRF